MKDMDEDFSSRVDKLEYEVRENRHKMNSMHDDVNTMNRTPPGVGEADGETIETTATS